MEQKSTYKLHYAEPYWSIMWIVTAGWLATVFILLLIVDAAVDAREEVDAYKAAMIKAEENYRAERARDICAEIEDAMRREGRKRLAELEGER